MSTKIIGIKTRLVPFDTTNQAHAACLEKWTTNQNYKYYFKNIPEIFTFHQLSQFPLLLNMNVLMIEAEGQIVGMATWDNVRVLPRSCEMGFLIDKDFQGKGYTKDAFMFFLNYLFSRLGFHKVSAKVAANEFNTVGKSVWGGFTHHAILKDEFYLDGKWQDDVLLSVLDHEFKERFNLYLNGEQSWVAKAAQENPPIRMKLVH